MEKKAEITTIEDLVRQTDNLKRVIGAGQWTLEVYDPTGLFSNCDRIRLTNHVTLKVLSYRDCVAHLLYNKPDIRLIVDNTKMRTVYYR